MDIRKLPLIIFILLIVVYLCNLSCNTEHHLAKYFSGIEYIEGVISDVETSSSRISVLLPWTRDVTLITYNDGRIVRFANITNYLFCKGKMNITGYRSTVTPDPYTGECGYKYIVSNKTIN